MGAGVPADVPLLAGLVLVRRRDDESAESRSLMTMPLNQRPNRGDMMLQGDVLTDALRPRQRRPFSRSASAQCIGTLRFQALSQMKQPRNQRWVPGGAE